MAKRKRFETPEMARLRELRDQNRESMERGLISVKVTRARKGENMANPKTANEAREFQEALMTMQRAREQAGYEALEQQKAKWISQMMVPLSPPTYQLPRWTLGAAFGEVENMLQNRQPSTLPSLPRSRPPNRTKSPNASPILSLSSPRGERGA